MPQICQRLGIPGFALNRKLFNHEGGLKWTCDQIRAIAADMASFITDGLDQIDTRLNWRLMEVFGGLPPLLLNMDHQQPSGYKSAFIIAPGAVPCTMILHTLTNAHDPEGSQQAAKRVRDLLHDTLARTQTTVSSEEVYFATELRLRLTEIADRADGSLAPEHDTAVYDDDLAKIEILEVADRVRQWHYSMLGITKGEIWLDRAALRVGRMVRLTNARWPEAVDLPNPLIDAALLDAAFGPIEAEDEAALRLDAIEALKLIAHQRYVELVAAPEDAVGNINQVPSLCLSEQYGRPLINLVEPAVYQTHEIIVAGFDLPETVKAQAAGQPLEQFYTSAFTDGLGMKIIEVGHTGYTSPQDWHNHHAAHRIFINLREAAELPPIMLEDHIHTGETTDNPSQSHAPALSIHINNAAMMSFVLTSLEAMQIIDDKLLNPRKSTVEF